MCPARCSSFARPKAARAAALAAAAATLLVGCKVDADVEVQANSDGTGEVTVAVTLDEAAAKEVGPLEERVRVDDLRDAGWTVVAEDRTIRATKRFEHPDDASAVVQEVGGPLVSRARVTREAGFAKTTSKIDVELDLSAGVAGFADAALQEQLGGLPAGVNPEDISVSLTAQAPGENPVTVDVPVGEKAAVAAAGSDWHVIRVAAAVAAPLLAIAAAVLFWKRRTVPAPVTADP